MDRVLLNGKGRIYVLNGLPGVGKTLFGKIVGEKLGQLGVGFLHISSIDLVKHTLLPKDNWDEQIMPRGFWEVLENLKKNITDRDWDGQTKDVYWRGVMSDLKLSITSHYPDLINEWLWSRVVCVESGTTVFLDIREPENIEKFKSFCREMDSETNVRTICVLSDRNDEYDNYSDGQVMNYEYDIYLKNYRSKHGEDFERSLMEYRGIVTGFIETEVGIRCGHLERVTGGKEKE